MNCSRGLLNFLRIPGGCFFFFCVFFVLDGVFMCFLCFEWCFLVLLIRFSFNMF